MGTTPNLGIEYPDPSGVPSRKSWIEDPIKSVDAKVQAAITALSMRTKSGTVSATLAANTTTKLTVTFTTPFATTPVCTASPATSVPEQFSYSVGDISTTGFSVYVRRTSAGPVSMRWIATDLGNA